MACNPCGNSCTSCTGSCSSGCGGCGGSCSGGCGAGCGSGCASGCRGGCTSCSGCSSCSDTCTGNCSGSCQGNCSGCSGTCTGGCQGSCSNGCNTGCTNSTQTDALAKLNLATKFEASNIQDIANFIAAEVTRRGSSPTNVTFSAGNSLDKTKINSIKANLNLIGFPSSYADVTTGQKALRALGEDIIAKAKEAYNELIPL